MNNQLQSVLALVLVATSLQSEVAAQDNIEWFEFYPDQYVDISADQAYYNYQWVGDSDALDAPFFRETNFQVQSDTREAGFEWKMMVSDGKNAPHWLELLPGLREDLSVFFNVYSSSGEDSFIDCRHEMESCERSVDIGIWKLDYSIELETYDVIFDFTIPQVDSFRFLSHVNFMERAWNGTLYSKDTEVFSKTWDYTRRSDQEEGTYRNVALDYDFEGMTNDGYEYNLEESINFLPGYALGDINFEAAGLNDTHANFLIMKPTDFVYILELEVEDQPKVVLKCIRSPGKDQCEDSQQVGEFQVEVWQTSESDCIKISDNRMDSWAMGCHWLESDTWDRSNGLYYARTTGEKWSLSGDGHNDWNDDNKHADSKEGDEMADEWGNSISDFLDDMFDGATHVSAFGVATLAMMMALF